MGSTEQIAELISSLEQATLMAHQLGTAVDANQLLQISSSLRAAHHRLSAFLSSTPSAAAEPMQLGDEEEEANGEAERDSAVGMVEEKMSKCFIRNKRRKRSLSPSSLVVETEDRNGLDFDPHASKLRAFDLIYQFHG